MKGNEAIQAMFLYATEGIVIANDRGEIVSANPSAEKLFGYEKDALLGLKVETLVPRKLAEAHQQKRSSYHQHPHARKMGTGMELFASRKDGTEFPVEISLSPYTTEKGSFVIAFIIDITIRRQAEEKLKNYSVELEKQVKNRTLILEEAIEELERTKKELYQALEKEKELSELKSRFVSMASHEFRTPLATILSSLSLVTRYGERNEKEKQDRHIAKIKSSINDLTGILNDFLSVSKLEEGRVQVQFEWFNLKNFIAETLTEMQAIAKSGQHICHNHMGKEDVFSDTKILKNILFNLISNAIKFSAEGTEISVTSESGNEEFVLRVADKGIGIPTVDKEHLFGRFFRAHNATHIQGTGLGLNIVAKYSELLGATIDWESEEGKGTTFILRFPMQHS